MGRFNFGKSDVSSTDTNTERRPSAVEALDNATRRKSVDDHAVTGAGEITTKQSIIPVRRELLTAVSCLTITGVSRHRPLLHVGLRIRTPRRPEQALPGNPSRHCRTVVRSSSVCKPTRYHASSAYNKTVHTSEPTLSVPSHTAAGSCASSDTDGHSSPVSASTAWELCSSGLVV